jgi:hypothetical protein
MAKPKIHKLLIGCGVAALSLAGNSNVRANASNVTNVSASGQILSPLSLAKAPLVHKKAILNTNPTASNQASALATSGAFACPNCSALQNSNVPLNLDGSNIQSLFTTTASLSFPEPDAQTTAQSNDPLSILPDWERTSTYQNYQQSLSRSRATFSTPFWDASTGFNADAVRQFFSFLPQEYADESFGPKGTPLVGMPVTGQAAQSDPAVSPLFQQPAAALLPGLPLVIPGSNAASPDSGGVSPFAALMSFNFIKVSGDCSKTDLA